MNLWLIVRDTEKVDGNEPAAWVIAHEDEDGALAATGWANEAGIVAQWIGTAVVGIEAGTILLASNGVD